MRNDTWIHLDPSVKSPYTERDVNLIFQHPHILGHILGYLKLTELHDYWIWHLWGQPEGIHTSLMAHRGSFKTTAETIVAPIWWLLWHPEDRIGVVRKSFKVSGDTLAAIERGLRKPEIAILFDTIQPDRAPFHIKAAPFGKIELSCKTIPTTEVSLQSYGVDQLPVGTHLDRVEMDDVVGRVDRYSKAERERTVRAVQEILGNIIDPGKTVMHVGTRWHDLDAWTLWLPKKKEHETEDDVIDGDSTNVLQAPLVFDDERTGLLSSEQKQRLKRILPPAIYAINYKLKIIPDDGQLFQNPVYEAWDRRKDIRVFMHVDAKWEGNHTMGVTFAGRRPDGKIQIYGKIYTDSIVKKSGEILKLAAARRVRRSFVETNPDKGHTAELLSKAPGINLPPIPVTAYSEKMNKHVKISSYIMEYWDELVFDPDTDEAYMAQILDYREGQEPDDGPDSLASLLQRAFYPVDPRKGRGNVLNEY